MHTKENIERKRAMRAAKEAELHTRMTSGKCALCGRAVPPERVWRRSPTPSMFCSRRCADLGSWVRVGRISAERARLRVTLEPGEAFRIGGTRAWFQRLTAALANGTQQSPA